MGSVARERRPFPPVRGRTNHYGCTLGDEVDLAGPHRSDFQNTRHYLPAFAFYGKLPW
jgi:hypothetical protein